MLLLFTNAVNLLATLLVVLLGAGIYASVYNIRRGHTLRSVLSVAAAVVLAFLTGLYFLFIFLFAPR